MEASKLSPVKGVGWWAKLQKNSPLMILVVAATLTAVYTANDSYIMHNIIKAGDAFTAVMAYLTIGGWVGLLINWLMCQTPAGWVIDPDFRKITLISPRAQVSALVAGAVGALSTLFMLWGSQLYDPSIVLPLSNVAILYVVMWEAATGKVRLRDVMWPALIVIFGAVLSTFNLHASLFVSAVGLVVLLLLKNGISAFAEILEQTGVVASDATSFGFWRFLWLTVTGTLLAVMVSAARGMLGLYVSTLTASFLPALPWIVLTMVLVYFGMGLKNVSKKHTSVSVVTVVFVLPVIMGVPLTMFANWLMPGAFADAPVEPVVWAMRFVGAALVLSGIVLLQRRKCVT